MPTCSQTWHSRFARRRGRGARLAARTHPHRRHHPPGRKTCISWHPGQQWIWEPGGLGVFDPGINALSILTRILPRPFFLSAGPNCRSRARRAAPIAADLVVSDDSGLPIRAEFDWRQTGPQSWNIRVETDASSLSLSGGGGRLVCDDRILLDEKPAEYHGVYRRFVELVARGEFDVDLSPLVHVADAFMLGRRGDVEPFIER